MCEETSEEEQQKEFKKTALRKKFLIFSHNGLHQFSQGITTKSELDIFATSPTQSSIEGGATFCYRPISTVSNTAPIEFLATASGDEY